jgi:hypothetical protein
MTITEKKLTRMMALLIVFALAALLTGQASARLIKCRADPIFYLSNGEKVTVILDVGTDAANVRNISYVLHVPAGVTITRVVFTAGGLGRKEMFKAVQDSAEKVYITDTTVTTRGGPYWVTASVNLLSGIRSSASGFNGELLTVKLAQTLETIRY